MVVAVLGVALALLPNSQDFVWAAMALLVPLFFMIFFMRALYFAPYGEMGLPQRFSGSVIAMASFIVYLPSSFAYLLWALILDGNPGAQGYALMFFALSIVSVVGFLLARALRQRMRRGTADRVAVLVAELDAKLGLQGREKRLSDLINQRRS